jgi:squalene-associated FAD-dependent desaturase
VDSGRVAIVGAGWAGLAAAVTLSRAGYLVTLFEQGNTLGGRARRVAIDGIALDNGQHLVIGAYRQTQDLIATVHGPDRALTLFHRLPLTLAPLGAARHGAVSLQAWRLPAPLHLAAGILAARGLSWRDRLALARGFRAVARAGYRCPAAQTVAECFAATPRHVLDEVWAPLCIAALNTPPAQASARVFATVLRDAFGARAGDSDLLVPACDLSSLFPDAAGRYVATHRGEVRSGLTVRGVKAGATHVAVRTAAGEERFAAAIVAVGPHQLAATVGDQHDSGERSGPGGPWSESLAQVAKFTYQSITTVYLAYPSAVALPAPIARLDDAPGQWVFDRSDALTATASNMARTLLAVVISTNGPHDGEDHTTLAALIDRQLRRLSPALPRPLWSRVIAERRATHASTPALARPAAGRVAAGLYLAGDYTDATLPPTLEAATRSGVAAARAVVSDLGRDHD